MKMEWQIFFRRIFNSAKSVRWALGLSFLFFLINLAQLGTTNWQRLLAICLAYALVMYFFVWVSYALIYAWKTYRNTKGHPFRKLTLPSHFAISTIATLVGALTMQLALAQWFDRAIEWNDLPEAVAWGLAIASAFIFYHSYRYSQEEKVELAAANAENKFHVLKNQMQPHFLFNALNGLSELIAEDPEQAGLMAQKLSDLYREILINSKTKTASINSELSIVKKYLELEQIRYGKRLSYKLTWKIPSSDFYLPGLILQTLVENAIKHGVEKTIGPCEIEIDIDQSSAGDFIVTISNTLTGQGQINPGGSGLENTRNRLQLLYGKKSHFDLRPAEGKMICSFSVTGEVIA